MSLKNFFPFILIFILFTTHAFSQKTKKVKVKLDNKTLEGGFKLWLNVKVEHKDTNFFQPLFNTNEIIELNKTGNYSFTFYSIFGHELKRELLVSEKDNYVLNLSSLKRKFKKIYKKSMLSDQLKINDTLYILSLKTGNNLEFEKLSITRLPDNRYKAMLFKGFTDETFMDYTVKESEYAVVKTAEQAVKQQSGDCKNNFYFFGLKNNFYIISDRSCSYNVIEKIKLRLFIVERK